MGTGSFDAVDWWMRVTTPSSAVPTVDHDRSRWYKPPLHERKGKRWSRLAERDTASAKREKCVLRATPRLRRKIHTITMHLAGDVASGEVVRAATGNPLGKHSRGRSPLASSTPTEPMNTKSTTSLWRRLTCPLPGRRRARKDVGGSVWELVGGSRVGRDCTRISRVSESHSSDDQQHSKPVESPRRSDVSYRRPSRAKQREPRCQGKVFRNNGTVSRHLRAWHDRLQRIYTKTVRLTAKSVMGENAQNLV